MSPCQEHFVAVWEDSFVQMNAHMDLQMGCAVAHIEDYEPVLTNLPYWMYSTIG